MGGEAMGWEGRSPVGMKFHDMALFALLTPLLSLADQGRPAFSCILPRRKSHHVLGDFSSDVNSRGGFITIPILT